MSTAVSNLNPVNPIVETYSRLAREYDEDANFHSCWGRASERALSVIRLRDDYKVIVDMGCGPGRPSMRWPWQRRLILTSSVSILPRICAA
jgi:hypothetical protein